jgi:3-phenylpropionate/trans-cinnamate dioxygenase ferredoxin subunit
LCLNLGQHKILLIWHNDAVYALENQCSHASKPLTEGNIEGTEIRCPYHGASFSLKDGSHLSPPAFRGIQVYPTRLKDNHIEVFLADSEQ